MRTKSILLSLCLVGLATADLRIATHPRNGFGYHDVGGLRKPPICKPGGGRRRPMPIPASCHSMAHWMTPSPFAYKGLKYPGGQKYNNYDNFLRSNIDNEQDNRDFNREAGRDHLPFRTFETKVDTVYRNNRFDGATPRPKDIRKTMKAGDSLVVPLRW